MNAIGTSVLCQKQTSHWLPTGYEIVAVHQWIKFVWPCAAHETHDAGIA